MIVITDPLIVVPGDPIDCCSSIKLGCRVMVMKDSVYLCNHVSEPGRYCQLSDKTRRLTCVGQCSTALRTFPDFAHTRELAESVWGRASGIRERERPTIPADSKYYLVGGDTGTPEEVKPGLNLSQVGMWPNIGADERIA
jgi:hypothetical protein